MAVSLRAAAAVRCYGRGFAALSAPRLAMKTPQFTDEQINEIARHDALLAQQIRTAREHGLAMQWKDFERIPVYHVPQPPPEPKKPETLAEAAAAGLESMPRMFEAMKSKLGYGGGKLTKK